MARMARFRDSALYRVYWWLSELKLAIVLLSIILVGLIAGTIFEAQHGNKAAQFLFYNSRWFDVVLIFFGLNFTCCTIRRFKRKLSQIGFMTTHVGVMVILVGGLISRNFKTEGQLIIPEGESRSYLLLDGTALRVSVAQGGERVVREYDTAYDKLGGRTEVDDHFRVPEADLELIVDRYYPDMRFEEVLSDDNPAPNPALDLRVVGMAGEIAEPLFARGAERREVRAGVTTSRYVEAADGVQLASELGKPGPVTSSTLGEVEVVVAGKRGRITIPVDGGLERPQMVAGSDIAVTLEQFFPDFAVSGERYGSRSPNLANPAVLVDVVGPGARHERHLLFSDHPDVNLVHREGEPITESASYRLKSERPAAIAGQVKFVRAPSGEVHYVIGGDGFAERRGVVVPGEAIAYPETGTELIVTRVLDNARLEERIWNGGKEERNPGVHVRLVDRAGGPERDVWVAQGVPREVAAGDRQVTIDYNWKQHDLGFSVALKDFREITYPGIAMAKSFESDVVVTAPDKEFDRLISMNNPLKVRGYKIFQSSFQRGERETSIFSVARDPGVPVVYTGCLILVLGLILIFFLKPYLVRASGSRRNPSLDVQLPNAIGETAFETASTSSVGGGSHRGQ